MPTDQQISILCDITSSGGAGFINDSRQELVELIAAGYIERDPAMASSYKLTAKGQKALDDRGVGANEA